MVVQHRDAGGLEPATLGCKQDIAQEGNASVEEKPIAYHQSTLSLAKPTPINQSVSQPVVSQCLESCLFTCVGIGIGDVV
jgi:hypothetical protein